MAQNFVAATVLNIDDIKNQLRKASKTVNLFRSSRDTIPFRDRAVRAKNQDIGNHFTLDHPTNGVLDSATLELDTGLGSLSTAFIQWRDSVVKEYLYVTEFVDSSLTTADVVSSTGTVTFTDGELLVSESLTAGLGNIVSATFISSGNASGTGTLSYYLSADGGSNWELTSLNTLHTFTNTGSALKYKVESSGDKVININNNDNTKKPISVSYNL